MFKKILKIIFIVVVIFFAVQALFALITLTIEFYNFSKLLEKGEKFEFKTFYSPKKDNKVTLMIHTDGVFDYETYIYIIDGEYKEERPPANKNYIKFPDGTGVYIRWKNNNNFNILSDTSPKVNNLKPEDYNINLTVSREKIDAFFERGEGDKVIRYQIKD